MVPTFILAIVGISISDLVLCPQLRNFTPNSITFALILKDTLVATSLAN